MLSKRFGLPLALVATCALAPACKQEPPADIDANLDLPAPPRECEEDAAKYECYRRKARETGAGSLCLLLGDQSGADRPQQAFEKKRQEQANCLTDVARATKDGKWCNAANALWSESSCAVDVAQRTKDVRVCQSIKSRGWRDRCVEEVAKATRDASACRTIIGAKDHDSCVKNVVAATRDARQCVHSKNPSRRDECRRATSPAACELMENATTRASCYADQLRDVRDDPARVKELCEKSGSLSDRCFQRAALNGHPAYCERVGTSASSPARRVCYMKALSSRVSDCDGITEPQVAQRCLLSLPNVTEATCGAVTEPDVADGCWAKLGTGNVAACLRIKDSDRRSHCVSAGWRDAKDPRVCAELSVPSLKTQCQELVR